MKKLTNLLIMLLSACWLHAQTPGMVKAEGDRYFNNEQYFKAIEYYLSAVKRDPDLVSAKYQLGESYRLTFDTETAEFYYGEVANSNSTSFPLARYYYGVMKKVNNKPDEALIELNRFIGDMKNSGLNEDDRYRVYYKQGRIEMEGCRLTLNATTKPHRQFEALPAPINTEFNDYGAYIHDHDSSLVFSSGRRSGKGSLIDYKFGESFADLFRFELGPGGWKEVTEPDRFDGFFNSKWGEGAGVYNADFTKFYYTHCNDEQGTCFIYKSDMVDGRWQEPVPLNENINVVGFNSKHPSVTSTGDTLFFSSERTGGQGGFDIWYSVSSANDNWGQPINMGTHVNTSFDEISPFYYADDKALFFASTGHRGFGGFDVFMAKGQSFDRPEIFNVDAPYNSSQDDCFMVIGKDYGYISSNRDGGQGKFDVYRFINEKDEDPIIAEIEVDEAVAGRNSLFSNDYEFDTPDEIRINQLISQFLANKIANTDAVLDQELLSFYNGLSRDDKEKVDRIVNARYRKMTQGELRSLRVEDEFYYRQLGKSEREKVDQIIFTRLEQKDLALGVSFDDETRLYYRNLDKDKRERVDQIVAYRVNDADRNKFVPDIYPTYSSQDRQQIDLIVQEYFTQKKSLNMLPLRPNSKLFLRDQGGEKLNEAIKEKVITLAEDRKFQLTEDDRIFFQNLDSDQLTALENIASAFVLADPQNLDNEITQSDRTFYRLLNSVQRNSADRILAKLINNLPVADLYYAEVNFTKPEISQIRNSYETENSIDAILTELSGTDDRELITKEDNVERMNRFVEVSSDDWLANKLPGFIPDTGEEDFVVASSAVASATIPGSDAGGSGTGASNTTSGGGQIAGILLEPTVVSSGKEIALEGESESDILEPGDAEFYQNQTPEDQLSIDRYIGAQYINAAYTNRSLITTDNNYYRSLPKQEKEYVELLARKVKGGEIPYESVVAALNHYNNAPISIKQVWNRIVFIRSLENVNGRYRAKTLDYRLVNRMPEDNKAIVQRIAEHRTANARLISDNFLAEAIDVPKKSILDNLMRYNTTNYPYITISGQLTDENTGKPMDNIPLGVQPPGGEVEYQTYTDFIGRFEFENIPSKNYQIISLDTEQEKFAESFFIRDLSVTGYVENILTNEVETAIYYNSGITALRAEGEVTLQEVADVYKNDPSIKIELNGHTDNVGQEQLNLDLSKRRAEIAYQELVNLGVSPNHIIINFHGLYKPVTTNLSRYGRQFNRRVEIKLQSSGPIDYDPPIVYLIRPEGTLFSIANHFNTTVDELKALNGITQNSINAFEPIRVRNPMHKRPLLKMLVELNTSVDTGLKNYTVQRGDTLESIAQKYNLPEEFIMEINNMTTREIAVGQVLKIYLTL